MRDGAEEKGRAAANGGQRNNRPPQKNKMTRFREKTSHRRQATSQHAGVQAETRLTLNRKRHYGGLKAANTVQLGGGLLEVHADGADALRREPRRHAVREGERCSEAKHELCRKEDLATALHLFASQPELERCVELGVLFAELFGTLSPRPHHKTSTLSMPHLAP